MHKRTALSALLVTVLCACGADSSVHPVPLEPSPEPQPQTLPADPLTPQLDAILDRVVEGGTVGVSLFVERPGHEPYYRARGSARLDPREALTTGHVFRLASLSKTYLAVLLTKLSVEGRLSLEDPITRHLPAELVELIPGAEGITVYDLLTLWSGIADYRDETFTLDVLFGDHTKVRDEYTDLVDGLRRNPTPCAPPELPIEQVTPAIAECLYSNTNYVLAGYVADKVLYGVDPAPGARPEHHARAFREALFAPLGLTSTFYEKHLAPGESFVARLAHGYYRASEPGGGATLTDVTSWDDGYGYGNGGLVGTLDDVAAFRRAVFDPGRAYPMRDRAGKARFLELLTRKNALDVAPGGITRGDSWAFSGDIGGYTCWAQYSPARDASFVLCSNDRDFEAAKFDLVGSLDALLASTGE